MAEFEDVNDADGPEVMSKLASIKVPWTPKDIRYWFFELELQMTLINIQSQWLKRVILANNLPDSVRGEVKEFLKMTKAEAGATIYKEIKNEIIALYKAKGDESFEKASQMLLETTPSALVKKLANELCDCKKKLDKCCSAKTVSALWRRQLPQPVRTAI